MVTVVMVVTEQLRSAPDVRDVTRADPLAGKYAWNRCCVAGVEAARRRVDAQDKAQLGESVSTPEAEEKTIRRVNGAAFDHKGRAAWPSLGGYPTHQGEHALTGVSSLGQGVLPCVFVVW